MFLDNAIQHGSAYTKGLAIVESITSTCRAVGIFYDAGDFNMAEPVIKKMWSQGVQLFALVMGTAAQQAEKALEKHQIKHLNKDMEAKTEVTAQGWKREALLPSSDVDLVVQRVSLLNPQFILTGTHSAVQFQLTKAIIDRCALGSENVYCNYDTVHVTPENHADGGMTPFLNAGYRFLVPNGLIAARMSSKVSIVGHPPAERFVEDVDRARENRAALFSKLGFSEKEPVITYIAGYGVGYEESFCGFLQSIKFMREREYPQLQVIVQIHPKFKLSKKEELAESILIKRECNVADDIPGIFVCVDEVSTAEAVSMADLVLSYFSTVVAQAIAAGVPAHFMCVDPEDPRLKENLMIEGGIFRNLSTAEAVNTALKGAMASSNRSSAEAFFTRTQTPTNATDAMVAVLQRSLAQL